MVGLDVWWFGSWHGIIADSEGIQSRRRHLVIAAGSGDLDGGLAANETQEPLKRRVIGSVSAMKLLTVVVNRFFRSFGECRTMVSLQRLDDVSRKVGFACQWLMDCPFHLRFLPACGDENHQLAQSGGKARVVAQLCRAACEFRTVKPDTKRPGDASPTGEDLIIELLPVSIQLVATEFSDAAHVAFSASHR
jgi:hypothetical protein